METSLALRIGAIFEIGIISAFGVLMPFFLIRRKFKKVSSNSDENSGGDDSVDIPDEFTKTLMFRSTKSFSGGLVLAVSFHF